MRGQKTIVISLIIIVIAIIISFTILLRVDNRNNKIEQQICFRERCFDVEIARTEKERSKGLMFRKNLNNNSGMLFIFKQSGVYPFWMKNTLIPLDIIWINEKKEIVFIKGNAQPCESKEICDTINPNVLAKYVIELNAGEVDRARISVGEKVFFKNINI